MRSVFLSGVREQRRAFLGCGAGIVLAVLLECALWPTIRTMPDLNQLLAGYPESIRRLFDLQEFGSGTGFANAELFRALIPVLLLAFAISRGARSVAAGEQPGRPLTTGLVLVRAAALLVTLVALGAVLFLSVLAGSALFGLGIGLGGLGAATTVTVALAFEFGCLALAAGALTGRRRPAVRIATTCAGATYLLYAAGQVVDSLHPWQPLSPFEQMMGDGPLGGGFHTAQLALPLSALVFLVSALPVLAHRRVGVAH